MVIKIISKLETDTINDELSNIISESVENNFDKLKPEQQFLIHEGIKHIDFKDLNLPIRIQLYIKTKALINIGYQSGVNDSICRYSKVICTPSTNVLGADYLKAIKYLK